MKLNIVPARTGLAWARAGLKTFVRQPLAMSGLFFLFMALLSLTSMLPFVGTALALVILPAATLGLMAASQQASEGRFPMPTILVSAFRAGPQRTRAMLTLGALYAAGFLGVMGLSVLIDGGQFARLYLGGGELTPEVLNAPGFEAALWVSSVLYLPLSMMFWHAPALVHWHDVPPVKSLFFSLVACLRNWAAFLVYGLVWIGALLAMATLLVLAATLLGRPGLAITLMAPAALLLAAVFFTSLYFTVRDCFSAEEPPAA